MDLQDERAKPVQRKKPIAPYARVKQHLKRELARGRFVPGALMPSEAELVARFKVSRMTVNRAVRELQSEGLVERVQGVGTFAAELGRVASTLTIRDLHDEVLARGHVHRAEVQLLRAEPAVPELAARFGLAVGATVFHSVIVHHENDVPLQCEDRYVNPACAPGYLDVDFTQCTPTHVLLDVAPLSEAQYTIEAAAPTVLEARLLGISRHAACLIVTRLTASRGVPVTWARLVHPGTRYVLEGQFKP